MSIFGNNYVSSMQMCHITSKMSKLFPNFEKVSKTHSSEVSVHNILYATSGGEIVYTGKVLIKPHPNAYVQVMRKTKANSKISM